MKEKFRGKDGWSDKKIDELEVTVDRLLVECRLKVLNLDTVYKWMRKLGFKYETRKKHF